MILLRYFVLFVCIVFISCRQSQQPDAAVLDKDEVVVDSLNTPDSPYYFGGEALLLTRFRSLDQFRQVVDVKYLHDLIDTNASKPGKEQVRLTYRSGDRQVIAVDEGGDLP